MGYSFLSTLMDIGVTDMALELGDILIVRTIGFLFKALCLTNPGGAHHLEVGGGLGLMALEFNLLGGGGSASPPDPRVYFPLHLGYRFQQPDGGFLLRLGFTPLIATNRSTGELGVLPWGGLSLGWSP
ncbi:MAG: hypothetical protein RML35_04135 [Chloroherpetonaceae bacterium]|nr:hypothetical protein [Chloroherpetonaceae bacterium]